MCKLTSVRAVIVAVGGGGDAITSATLGRLLDLSEPPTVITYSWDRLLIDPLPGPRRASDFTGLTELAPLVLEIVSTTAPIPPAGSSLPRLAAEMPARFFLLDPTTGAVGMAEQISATAKHFDADRIVAVDVGGDALTDGHDPGLRSPLADQLALAACWRTGLPTTLLIAAPAIDGELSPTTIATRLHNADARIIGRLTTADAQTTSVVLRWHPSEASGLLAAATLGLRGKVEVRDAGDQVELTDETILVHSLDLPTIFKAIPAAGLTDTCSLDQAEKAITAATGISELRYEAAKAARRTIRPGQRPTTADLVRVDSLADEAEQRGADFISMRRLAELINASNLDAYAQLARLLAEHRPRQYAIGAYKVRPSSAARDFA
jgi:hypothetical protein